MLTAASRQADFPALSGITYLNTAAESIPPVSVGEAVQTYWQDKLCGMSGRDSHFAHVEACREISAKMIAMQLTEVSFCSCSSEAYNLLASALNLGPADEVVISDLDFPAGATPWLCAARPPQVSLWKANQDGELLTDDLVPLLGDKTRLVQVSMVSFYNGFRIDWQSLKDAVRRLAPNAIIAVDITQAFGRVPIDCNDADILISSTHKWTLGIHGGCVVGIPTESAEKLTTHAGGWLHVANAFEADRFERAITKTGAASFSVGMPNFVSLYALNASLRYLDAIGLDAIAAHANPLVEATNQGLIELGLRPMTRYRPDAPTGIVAFRHPQAAELAAGLLRENIHVMYHAGRIRIAIHGYNTQDDVSQLLQHLANGLRQAAA